MKKVKVSVDDFRDDNGNLVKERTITTDTEYLRYVTRSGTLWDNINSRCKEPYIKRFPRNTGCVNRFKSYNEFAEWCQTQFGYMNVDRSGRYWAIDKDLCNFTGEKFYSEDNCIFVPNWVNTILISCNSARGDYPIGVNEHKRTGKFIAKCGGYLGLWDTPEEAHRQWQYRKIDDLQYASYHSDIEGHTKLLVALKEHAARIYADIKTGKETTLDWL